MNEFRIASGVQIGEYVLESRIGAGGMGEVWRANQPLIETTVAIKILTFESAARKSQLERFLREARAVNRVQHRNLAKIFSFGELPDGRPYLVMEFLSGLNLRDFLRKNGILPFSVIYHIAEQVCRTLIAVHEQNVIHRDLKPENVFLVTEPGALPFVKVLDFGVAKLSDKEEGRREHPTQTGATLGTPGYMSPEQYENSKTVDVRADIYSVAIIIYEMITGEHPFELLGETAYVVIAKQLTTDPPKPSEKNPSRAIPKELDEFLLKALSRKPEERPKDCKEFLQGFQKALGDLRHEKELPTHAGEPTKLSASYQSLKAKKLPPPPPTKHVEAKPAPAQPVSDRTVPAIPLEKAEPKTHITPHPTKPKELEDPEEAISTQKFTGPQLLAFYQENNLPLKPESQTPTKPPPPPMPAKPPSVPAGELDPMRTAPDVDVPGLLRELLDKKKREEEEEAAKEAAEKRSAEPPKPIEPEKASKEESKDNFEFDFDESLNIERPLTPMDRLPPASRQNLTPANTPAPISLPTTSPGVALPTRTLAIFAGAAVLLFVAVLWLFGGEAPPNQKPLPATKPATAPATTPTTEPATEPADPCGALKEEARLARDKKNWAGAIKVLVSAQEKCPKDAEVQQLFGSTYQQKGDFKFACQRYKEALSLGLSGASVARTKKSMKDLKCK
jgi:serine/threonine protein kinase